MEYLKKISWLQTGMSHAQPKDLFLFDIYSVNPQFISN